MALYDVSTNEKKAAPSLVAGGTLYADSPIGTILPYGGASAPSGWFLCDGTAVSRTTYSELFAVIGTSFGAGDGSTTFNLPDMRESVPKGAGLTGHTVGAHLDADGLAVGEFLDDRIQEHSHNVPIATPTDTSWQSGTNKRAYHDTGSSLASTGAASVRKGATTEVKSVGVNYIIKAKMVGVPADFMAKVNEVINENAKSPISASNKLATESDIKATEATEISGITITQSTGTLINAWISRAGSVVQLRLALEDCSLTTASSSTLQIALPSSVPKPVMATWGSGEIYKTTSPIIEEAAACRCLTDGTIYVYTPSEHSPLSGATVNITIVYLTTD